MTVGALLLLAALGLLGASGALLAALLRLRSFAEFLVAAHAIAFAELVAVAFVLSIPRDLTRSTCLAGLGVCLVASAGIWWRAGRPSPPSGPAAATAVGRLLREPLLATLVAGVLLVFRIELPALDGSLDAGVSEAD